MTKRQVELIGRLQATASELAVVRKREAALVAKRDGLIERGRGYGIAVSDLVDAAGIARETYYSRLRKEAAA
jgi:hypothetical protein